MMLGFSIRFDSCDTKTFDVLLKTSDGIIPMEYMSQGMSSTIGWVGVLLQRLFELYEDDNAPQRRHALLIIDEIDSHLHPEWQRLLVPKLKEHFPGLQVIASTHSPLVIGSLEGGTIYAFNRSGDEVEIKRIDQSFKNYRADQILTASAFGLSSSRSPGWERTKEQFTTLLGKTQRSAEEEEEFKELSKEFAETPRSQETPLGREAADLVDSVLRDRVNALEISDEKKSKLASEAQAYLNKVSSL
jgi:predicted ATP-binding protein involved in virulence